jgi:hypothetical protein
VPVSEFEWSKGVLADDDHTVSALFWGYMDTGK